MNPGVLLREARRRANLTQGELARRIGVDQAVVARLERPEANPTLRSLERAVRATGHRLDLRLEQPVSSPVDDTLLARNLRLTPAERLAQFEHWHSEAIAMREHAERSRA